MAWLLPVLAVAFWWPVHSYWQSDDFLAIVYASDIGRALSDFWGNQYGVEGMVWFYRPLITLAFAFDAAVGGADPLVAHVSNALAHGASTLLVGLIAQRLLRGSAGWCAALIWCVSPSHPGSVLWAAGRVDSHTTVWILLSVFLLTRWLLGEVWSRAPALLAFVLALCSKESAMVLPGVAAFLSFAIAKGDRWRTAARDSWPFFAVLAAYLALRAAVLGRVLGGYEGGPLDLPASLLGLGQWTGMLVNPLSWVSDETLEGRLFLRHLGWVPVLLAVLVLLQRRRLGLLVCLLAFYVGCAVPLVQFWADTGDVKGLRYFYLPFVALALLIAAAGWPATLLALAAFALPAKEIREDYWRTFQLEERMHAMLEREANEVEPGLLFVAGMPRTNEKGNVLAFHLGFDRLLEPPFGLGLHRLFALRPLSTRPGTLTLPYGEGSGLPEGTTLSFVSEGILARAMTSPPKRLEVRIEGEAHLSSAVLWDLHQGRAESALVMPGGAAPHYRVTVFTAGGYLTSVLPDEAAAGDPDGRVSLSTWLRRGRYSTIGDDSFVALALDVPATFDLDTRFPVLVEAGRLAQTPAGEVFTAERVASAFVWITLDRDYAEWKAGRVPEQR